MINSSIDNKKIIVSFIFLIFIIITFQNITNNFSNDTFKSDKNESCELKTIDVVRFYEKTNIEYFAKYDYISIFPEINNISCLGKVIKIENSSAGLVKIYTYINDLLKNFIIVVLPLFLIIILKIINTDKKLNILFLSLLFFNLNIWTFTIELKIINIKLIFLYLFCLYILFYFDKSDKERLEKILIFSSIFCSILYSSGDFTKILHANENGYIGEFFKVNDINSSYIGNLSNSFVWKYLILYSENIFGDYFSVYLRIIIFIFTVILIFKIFQFFKVGVLASILIMLIYSPNNAVAGKDVMLGWVEPRTVAYLFLLLGIYNAYVNKLNLSLLSFTISFLFHFGVSIVNFPIYFFVLIKNYEFKKIIKFGLIYFLSLIPFIFSLLSEQGVLNRTNTIYYISERSPHHLYPFLRQKNEILQFSSQDWSFGLLLFCLIFIAVLFVKKYVAVNSFEDLAGLTIVSGIICVVNLVVVYLFPFSRYVLLHPFRTFSFFTFFSTIYLVAAFTTLFIKYINFNNFSLVLIMWFTFFFSYFLDDSKYYYSNLNQYQASETRYLINQKIPPVLIINPYAYTAFWSGFEPDYQIPTYLIRKFTPNNLSKMDIYLERLEELVDFYDGDCKSLDHLSDFIFIDNKGENNCGELIYTENNFYTYRSFNK